MRHLRALALCCVVGIAVVTAACGGNNTPTQPASPTVTDNFSGSLDSGGSKTYLFTVGVAGTVNATIVTATTVVNGVATPTTVPLGFDLGIWNGALCLPYYQSTSATAGTLLTAVTSLNGSYCVRVFDIGSIKAGDPVSYTGTIAHP